jgi:hypothetical protein
MHTIYNFDKLPCIFSIGDFQSLNINFILMENFAYFTLKEEYKRLHSVGDKLVEIDSLRIGNLIISFLSPYFFTKQVIAADLKLMLSSCFKYFLHQWYCLSTSSLRNKLLIEFLSENFLVFLSTSR